MQPTDPYLRAYAQSLTCEKCGAVNGCDCYDQRLTEVAQMLVNVRELRRAEVMAREMAHTSEDCDAADRLRQQADAWVAAIRRGDSQPIECESPRIPPEVMARYLKPVIEHFEAELDAAHDEQRRRKVLT